MPELLDDDAGNYPLPVPFGPCLIGKYGIYLAPAELENFEPLITWPNVAAIAGAE